MGWWWWIVACLGLVQEPAQPGVPPGARIGYCDGWRDNTCLRWSEGLVVLWLPEALGPVKVTWEGEPVALEPDPRGGRYARVRGVRAGAFRVVAGEQAWEARVELVVEPPAAQALRTAMEGGVGAARVGELIDAALASSDPEVVAVGLDARARRIDQTGTRAEAAEAIAQARAAYEAIGRRDLVPKLLTSHAQVLMRSVDGWDEAVAIAEELRTLDDPRLDNLARTAWLDSMVGERLGRIRAAIGAARTSVWAYSLLEYKRLAASVSQLAALLQAAGMHEEALRLEASTVVWAGDVQDDQCWRVSTRSNYGYTLLIALAAGVDVGAITDPVVTSVGVDPVPLLATALSEHRASCKRPASLKGDLITNLAIASWYKGDDAGTKTWLELARDPTAGAARNFEVSWLRGELALRAGALEEAQEQFSQALAIVPNVDLGRGTLLAMTGRARTLAAMGRVDEALAVYRAADGQARVFAQLVSLDQGRDAFLTEWDRMARAWVRLLLSRGRSEEAVSVVRDLRGALLSQLVWARTADALTPEESARWRDAMRQYRQLQEAREARLATVWSLSTKQRAAMEARDAVVLADMKAAVDGGLPERVLKLDAPRRAPGPGEVLVTWLEGDDGFYALAVRAEGTRVAGPFQPPAVEDGPTSAWFAPVADALRAARRVVILPSGRLRATDLHMRLLDGAPLITRTEVVWSLDLPVRAAAPPAPAGAVVVADSLGDLQNAVTEGQEVAAFLRGAGTPTELVTGEQATFARFADAVAGAGLLHVAGHGRAGEDALSAELLLANHQAFSVSNVLASATVPPLVVLSGCETARSSTSDVESLGLGQAFVVAGARAVVAAVRPVDDHAAAAWIARLYAAGFASGEPAAAFREAVRGAVADGVDVSAFRLLVP